MATAFTSLLGLALPVTGELSGAWGDTVNTAITSLLDSAVSGTTTLSADADVTLTTSDGIANEARQAILLWTATGSVTRNITAPARSKAYFVVNKTGGTQSIVIRGAGPTTGVTVRAGQQSLVVFDGTDFVEVASGDVDGPSSATDNAVARFDGTTGKLVQNSVVTIADTTGNMAGVGTLGVGAITTSGALTYGGVTLSNAVTGTGNMVLSTSPTLVTPALGTPASGVLTNATGLPISTGVSGLGTGVATALAVNVGTAGAPVVNGGALGTPASGTLTNATGLPISTGVSGLGTGVATALAVNVGTAGAPVVNGGVLGTPSSGTLTNATDLPISTGVSGLGTGVATFLATPSSANLAAAVTDETGSGALVFANSPTLVTPALGTPASGVVTNLTGTASININGTVGATTASTGAFTNLAYTGTLTGGTGVVNLGSGQLFKDANGNVGIGTSSPTTKLHVNQSADNSGITLGNSVRGPSRVELEMSGVSNEACSFLHNNNTNRFVMQTMSRDTFTFQTNNTERLRITSAGNVGIGTSSPAGRLDVSGGASDTVAYVRTTSTSNGVNARINLTTGNRDFAIQNLNDGSSGSLRIVDVTASTERMRITSAGNVGIGTTAPSARLDVGGGGVSAFIGDTSGGNNSVRVMSGNSIGFQAAGIAAVVSSADMLFRTGGDFSTAQNVNMGGSERMRITSAGNVGIGTSSPATKLEVSGAAPFNVVAASVTNTSDSGFSVLQLRNTGASGKTYQIGVGGNVSGQNNNLYVFDATAGAVRAILDASGNLGLGVTPSAYGSTFKALQVGDRSAIVSVSDSTILSSNYFNDGTADKYMLSAAASVYQQIGGDHRWLIAPSGTAGNAITFTQAMTLDASGILGIGTTSPSSTALRVAVAGGVDSNLPVMSIRRTNDSSGGAGNPEVGLDVQIPNTFNNAGDVKGINVFARHNLNGTAYGIFAEAGGNPSASNRYSGYFKVTQPDTNGSAVNYAIYAQANANIGIGSSGFAIGVTSETSNYVNNQNFRAVSLYTGADTQTVLSIIRNTTAVGSITTTTSTTTYNTTSDYRLKTVIGPVADAGQRIDALQPVEYTWNADGSRTRGFLAHQFQEVYAGSVSGTKDAVDAEGKPVYQAMQASTSEVIADLVAELQSLRARVAQLESN